MSFLPCSCTNCRNSANDFDNREFKSTRNMQTRMIRQKKSNGEEPSSISDLNHNDLKDVCRARGLPASGRKDDLIRTLLPFMHALSYFDADDIIGNEFSSENNDIEDS